MGSEGMDDMMRNPPQRCPDGDSIMPQHCSHWCHSTIFRGTVFFPTNDGYRCHDKSLLSTWCHRTIATALVDRSSRPTQPFSSVLWRDGRISKSERATKTTTIRMHRVQCLGLWGGGMVSNRIWDMGKERIMHRRKLMRRRDMMNLARPTPLHEQCEYGMFHLF